MKESMKIVLCLLLAMLFMMPERATAQGKYGADSAECVTHLNFYRDLYNLGRYQEAYPQWTQAMQICPPTASQNMFIHGKKILSELINDETDEARRAVMIDSLLKLSDTRAEYYPSKAQTAIEDKLGSLMFYFGNDEKKAKEIFENISSYADRFGIESNAQHLVNGMIKAGEAYKINELTDEEVMTAYSKFNDILEGKKKSKRFDNIEEEEQMLQNAFVGSGVATCENLIAVFTPRFNENKNDTSMIKTIAGLLSANECTDSQLFSDVVSQMHRLNPSASSAYFLYRYFSNTNDDKKALQYLQEAAQQATDDEDKGLYTYELATIYLKNHSYPQAVQAANQAAQLNPKYQGKSYMIIGQIWAGTNCTGSEMDKRAKFWVATDYMNKAKNADASLAEEANKNIARYRSYYPMTEDAFMFDLTDGASYTVSCGGMTATTTVRTNK